MFESIPNSMDFSLLSPSLRDSGLILTGSVSGWLLARLVLARQLTQRIKSRNFDLHWWVVQSNIFNRLALLVPLLILNQFPPSLPTPTDYIGPLVSGLTDLWLIVVILTIAFSAGPLLGALDTEGRFKKTAFTKPTTVLGAGIGIVIALALGLQCYRDGLALMAEYFPLTEISWGGLCALVGLGLVFRVYKEAAEMHPLAAGPAASSGPRPLAGAANRPSLTAVLETQDITLLDRLLAQGAEIDLPLEDGKIPLIETIHRHLFELSGAFLERGANPNLRDKAGWTPLTLAAYTGQVNLVEQLIHSGADLDAPSDHGWTPLTWALHSGHTPIVDLLRQAGAETEHSFHYRWAHFPDRIDILNFLLNLFRLQTGARPDSKQRFFPLNFEADAADLSYRLEIGQDDQWTQRIVSLSLLGEGSSSKSRCYKVIFDTIWVVKIPPKPITQFKAYIKAIQIERQTVEQLSDDFVCIAPGVADILRKIPGFSAATETGGPATEKKAVAWLTESPGFHKYLKIGPSFAFFMDISRYRFLNQYLEKLHGQNMTAKQKNEIARQPQLITDLVGLETKYGEQHGDLCQRLQECYFQFETEIHQWLKTDPSGRNVSAHELKNWFVAHLFPETQPAEAPKLSPDVQKMKQAALQSLSDQHGPTLTAYRQLVMDDIADHNFRQNAGQMATVIKNLLLLLVKLQERGIIMRDLKPDNLFIINESAQAALGIIDFETAIHLNKDGSPATQPFIGGTPSYATLSHLFSNPVLSQVLGPVGRVFYYQDWYAVIAMIYSTVLGQPLFAQTARHLVQIMKAIRQQGKKYDQAAWGRCFQAESVRFWDCAWREFDHKTRTAADRLAAVKLSLPENIRQLLATHYQQHRKTPQQRVQSLIVSDTPFKDQRLNQKLQRASVATVKKIRRHWDSQLQEPKVKPAKREKILHFFDILLHRQKQAEKLDRQFQDLASGDGAMNAGTLMEMMFICVYSGMSRPKWEDARQPGKVEPMEIAPAPTRPDETTLLVDDTTLEVTLSNA